MFEKKTWVNRQSEHPARRRLTPTGNDNEFDVARAEGVIMEDGDAFDIWHYLHHRGGQNPLKGNNSEQPC